MLGELNLERAYYYCAACQKSFFPRDQALGLEESALSPAVLRMTGTVASLVSFQEGSELMKELVGVEVNAKRIERAAEKLGGEIAEQERHSTYRRRGRSFLRSSVGEVTLADSLVCGKSLGFKVTRKSALPS